MARIFKTEVGFISRFGDRIAKGIANNDRSMQKKIQQATHIVWATAHAKRPMITKAQMKAEGRSYRVSDPSAAAGVPVQTGRLQASIKENVQRIGYASYRGIVEASGVPYAGYLEYGTSKAAARPFMRPAVNLNRETIKRVYGVRTESNL